jgi:hypothetical protein
MPSGILNVVCYGCNDLYLTGAPQITLFKIAYRRYTNFSIESYEIYPNTFTNFSQTVEIIVPKIGDLVSKTYIAIDIPQTYFSFAEFEFNAPNIPNNTVYLTNYNTVVTFMKYNTAAYRTILRDTAVINISTTDILNDLNILINGDGQTAKNNFENLYSESLSDDLKYLLKTSNIYLSLNSILSTPSTNPSVISQVFAITQNCIQSSINVQQYYFNLYNQNQILTSSTNTANLNFSWNTYLGHNIIEYIDVYIGGEFIDRTEGEFLQLLYELKHFKTLESTYDILIGNVPELNTYNSTIKPAYTLYIPMQFWFTKNYGSAFPIVASNFNDMYFKIKFRNINDCGTIQSLDSYNYTLEDLWNNKSYNLNVSLFMDYIFLDQLERKKFAQSSHEYLIETTQSILDTVSQQSYTNHLDFKHPCKEFIWFFQKSVYRSDPTGRKSGNFNNFTIDTSGNPMISMSLDLNGYEKINTIIGTWQYFNYLQPYQNHRTTPSDGINVYSFALYPEEIQPSGTLNMSRLKDVLMTFTLNPKAFTYMASELDYNIIPGSIDDISSPTDLTFKLYAISYNVLRITNGYAALAFSVIQ